MVPLIIYAIYSFAMAFYPDFFLNTTLGQVLFSINTILIELPCLYATIFYIVL